MAEPYCCPVVELRQYTLHPGRRDELITLFDRELVETQEAVGMRVIGQFRDLDRPDRFVWLRGFADMPAREQALSAFYGGPAWKQHRNAANATMLEWDDVLLLRPARPAAGFVLDAPDRRPLPDAHEIPAAIVVATIYHLDPARVSDFPDFFENALAPLLATQDSRLLAHFVTETSPNTYPALPVRENDRVFVWFAGYASAAAHARHMVELQQSRSWTSAVEEVATRSILPVRTLRLSPTARSLLRG